MRPKTTSTKLTRLSPKFCSCRDRPVFPLPGRRTATATTQASHVDIPARRRWVALESSSPDMAVVAIIEPLIVEPILATSDIRAASRGSVSHGRVRIVHGAAGPPGFQPQFVAASSPVVRSRVPRLRPGNVRGAAFHGVQARL
jgi:hypothetical protein